MRSCLSIVLCVALCVLMPSCKAVSSLVHDGEVIARYSDQKLYRTELESVIPKGLSPEDSTRMADQYILSWAKEKAFLAIAEQSLSKQEKDVSKDLEAYRQALLKYRFEQHYINERLDTVVSEKQIEDFFEADKESFRLSRPIFKARFLKIPASSASFAVLKKLMSSDDPGDVEAADSIAMNSAQHYHDFSGEWIDASALAAEFDVDFEQMMSHKSGQVIEIVSGDDVSYSFIVDMVKAGEIPPLEFCRERIRDIVISDRKHELLLTLERDLIEEARSSDKFEIYSE